MKEYFITRKTNKVERIFLKWNRKKYDTKNGRMKDLYQIKKSINDKIICTINSSLFLSA